MNVCETLEAFFLAAEGSITFLPLTPAYFVLNSSLQIQESGAIRDVAQTAPIYVSSESSCQVCAKVFTFFVRKNHCHNWYVTLVVMISI